MPVEDYCMNNPFSYGSWDALDQTIGSNDETDGYFISISFDYQTVKYSASVLETDNDENVFLGESTKSFFEMKKRLVKFLSDNNISCGLPLQPDFWDLICKRH